MMDFCKVRRIVISALTLLFVAALGSNQRCVNPWEGRSFVYSVFVEERMLRLKKQSFVLAAYACFKNFGVTWMYVVADFCMMFNRGVDISVCSGLVFGSSRFPASFAFPNVCK